MSTEFNPTTRQTSEQLTPLQDVQQRIRYYSGKADDERAAELVKRARQEEHSLLLRAILDELVLARTAGRR